MNPGEALESQYSFSEKNGVEFIQIKSGDDFPWSLREMVSFDSKSRFRLAQAYSPRSYIKPTFKKVKDFKSRDEALHYIIARHNKACEHMPNWIPI